MGQVRYFTLLDIYLVISQRFIFLVAVEHAVLKRWFEDDKKIDDWCFVLTASLYCLIQVSFVLYAYKKSKTEEEKLALDVVALEEWQRKKKQSSSTIYTSEEMMISSCSRKRDAGGLNE